MWNWSVRTPGYAFAISAKRSSQYGMVKVMPFDLVALVRCRFGRLAVDRFELGFCLENVGHEHFHYLGDAWNVRARAAIQPRVALSK